MVVNDRPDRPIKIGISSCLLGERVRYDGGHKHDRFLTETLGRFVQWVPVCPEVEAGFGTPREPMQLTRTPDGIRLWTVETRIDVTGQLESLVERRVRELAGEDLSGYVLKQDSPSCGLGRVNVFSADGARVGRGRGLFAARLVERFPSLPIEDEGRLSDAAVREDFIARVLAYWRRRNG